VVQFISLKSPFLLQVVDKANLLWHFQITVYGPK
jgi:hypothetical protein